jgi:hypothetical protein
MLATAERNHLRYRSQPGALERLVSNARLSICEDGQIETSYEYSDLQTALRAIGSAGLTVLAERTAGQDAVTDAIAEALRPDITPTGGYRLEVGPDTSKQPHRH